MGGMSNASSALTSVIWKLNHLLGYDSAFARFDLSVNWQALEADKSWRGEMEG